jgi:hypothetical protein
MLTEREIKDLSDAGRLILVSPLEWRTPRKRTIYASPDVYRFLTYRSVDPGTNNERRKLQALFDRFTSGDFISIGLEPTRFATDIKRLSPPSAEVWEFKVRLKKDLQLRIFGRFAYLNTFVALTGPADRAGVNYQNEIVRCQENWRTVFDDKAPLYGGEEDDYIWPNGVSLRDS